VIFCVTAQVLKITVHVDDVVQETETWLKLRVRDFMKNPETRGLKLETETSQFVNFAKVLQKNVVIASNLNFFEFLVVSSLQIQQKKQFVQL